VLAGLASFLVGLDLPNRPDLNPDQRFATDPKPYLILFGIGFAVAVLGHLFKVKTMIALGILMIFLATVAIPLVTRLGY
jgi:hypothetical protein